MTDKYKERIEVGFLIILTRNNASGELQSATCQNPEL